MNARRRNPKKDPAARRRRGGNMTRLPEPGFGSTTSALLSVVPAEVLPLMALPAV